jgi:high-affinity nickel-transport protein
MNYAYGWALSEPVRKVWYSLTITGLSIAVAVAIAGVELIGLASDRLGLDGGAWSWVSGIDLNAVGFVIAAMFCVVFASSLAIWRYGRIEQRWTRPRPRRAPPPQRRPAT